MVQMLSVTEVTHHFEEYLHRVACQGECFILVHGDKPIAELRPFPIRKRLAELPALLASLPHLSIPEAEQLSEDLTAAREALAQEEIPDPWQS